MKNNLDVEIRPTAPAEAEAMSGCGEPSKVRYPMIFDVSEDELPQCLDVIHKSFKTVADGFGLTRENCPRHTSFMPLDWLEAQKQWGWHMFGLYAGKKMIGYFSLSDEGDQSFELHNLAVLPEYRHSGFGKMLLDHAKAKARELGANKIKIGIIEESAILKNWYIANGFVHTDARKFEHLPFTSGFLECELKGSV